MEPAGHPSEDLIEELVARGAVVVEGDRETPAGAALDALPPGEGVWLWVPERVFESGVDDQA